MDSDSATVQNPVPTTVLSFTSALNNQEYRLFVSLPASYEDSEQRYPVLYVLDGNALFSLVRQISEMMGVLSPREVPELIIVGVGYPLPTYAQTATIRGRDLTFEQFIPDPQSSYPWGETGGGKAFLEVLTEEILPFIDGKYRTAPADRGLIGWSMSGAFAHRTIFLHPGLFSRAVAIDSFDTEATRLAAQPGSTLPIKHLFFGYAGDSVSPEDEAELHSHLEVVKALGVRAKGHKFEGENHFSVVPAVISRGLRMIYAAS